MSPRPQFGFSVTPGPADGVALEAAEAEKLGYDRIGVWDSPALFREPWSPSARWRARPTASGWAPGPDVEAMRDALRRAFELG